MREKWARRIAFLTGQLVVVFAAVFAVIQNPTELLAGTESGEQPASTELLEPIVLDLQRIEAGRQVYQQQACSRCHSIDGEGNPRYPLDGVGEWLGPEELRDWIIGADELQGVLPTRAFVQKRVYRKLSADDLNALVIYMQSLAPGIARQ